MPLAAGTKLGVFEILAPLGKGGMGEVCRCHSSPLPLFLAHRTSVRRKPMTPVLTLLAAALLAFVTHEAADEEKTLQVGRAIDGAPFRHPRPGPALRSAHDRHRGGRARAGVASLARLPSLLLRALPRH